MRQLCAMLATIMTFVTVPVWAQQGTAELRGAVIDQQQAILPGVTVTVRNEDTGMFRETTSNPDGTYFFSGIVPGMYEIRAVLSGFKQYTRPGVRLEVGRTTTVDVTLEVGQIQEAVTVTAETSLIDLTSHEIGGHITSRELTEMPSVNRNFIGFIGMLPGIVPNISTESFGSDAVVVKRHRFAQQQLPDGRGKQQRRRDRSARGHAGADANRGDSGVPGAHAPVRRGVGADDWSGD